MDSVLLLDEIDKVVQSNYHGDPSAALPEVLDPERNLAFNAIQLSGYTHDENPHIARRFLLPKQLGQNGLSEPHVQPTEPGPRRSKRQECVHLSVRLAESYGSRRSSGPRMWTRKALRLPLCQLPCRRRPKPQKRWSSAARRVAWGTTPSPKRTSWILGLSRFDGEDREREARRGVVWGLVVTGMDEGEIMAIESIATPGSGHLKLTGSLGDVIKESAELALSWVKTHSYDLGITSKRAHDPLRIPDAMIDVHLHLPAGAQKKDGPSAGVAMVCAMVSLLTGKCVSPTTAMTDEITLRGRASAVGGVKEKVLGAHRAGANKVIVPWANRKDVEHDVPKEVRARMQFVFARTVREVLDAAFGEGTLPWRTLTPVVESKL
ncbi:Lon protease C-terminal proteolytic domain-containing protein [Lactarius sanguifluus]|nr:Lon protease C-terminal proteolytic domain-containing protein [Lactarius sanguifluus]